MLARITIAAGLLVLSGALAAEPLDAAVQWLEERQHSSGYENPAPVVGDQLASLRAISALAIVERSDEGSVADLLDAAQYDLSSLTTQELAHAWLAAMTLGLPVNAWRHAVLERQAAGGAFAKYAGGSADLHATITVLEVLVNSRDQHPGIFNGAFNWLFNQQSSDGAWYAGQPLRPSSYVTARAAFLLHSLRHEYNLTAPLTSARQALSALREDDGLWGQLYSSAATLRFLLIDSPESPETQAAMDVFLSMQQLDGGFAGDAYATAWALLVLHQAQQPPPPPGDDATLVGQVISADTGNPLATVVVELSGADAQRQTVTNINGRFEIHELTAGSYTLELSYPDHAPFAAQLLVPFNQVYDLGQIQLFMGQDSQTLIVRGVVSDAETGLPIAGSQVSGGGVSATTDAQGEYQLLSVLSGHIELLAEAVGYYSVAGSIQGEAGMIVDFSPSLEPGAGHHTGAVLSGTVTAEDTSQALAGATVQVSGANQAHFSTDSDGAYQGVLPQPGPVRILVSADGYHSAEWNTSVTAGGLIEFSPVLRPSAGPGPEGSGINGRIVSAGSNHPIDGADVTLTSGDLNLFLRTGSSGLFGFTELTHDSAILQIGASGHHPLQLAVSVPVLEVRDLGDIALRPIRLHTYLPDLAVTAIDLTVTDKDSFDLLDHIEVTVANLGTASTDRSFSVLAFIDAADNDQFDPNLDVIVGTARITGGLSIGEEKTVTIELDGTLNFRDAPVKVWIDSNQEIMQQGSMHPVVSTALGCRIQAAPLSSNGIRERWRWSGYSNDPRIANVATTPLVVQLTDDNGDGVIDQHDIPDIVFVAADRRNDINPPQTRLVALSGDDGRELWAVDHDLSHFTQLAAADINKDGYINIVGVTKRRTHLVAVNHDGSLLWRVPLGGPALPTPLFGFWSWANDYISITNLEGDAEAHVVYGRRVFRGIDGSLLWEGERDHGGYWGGYAGENPIPIGDGFSAFAADINLDGDKQIIAGRTVYDRLGNVVWHRDDLGEVKCDFAGLCAASAGEVAVANLDGDDYAEIILVVDGTLRVLNHDGTDLWGPIDLPDHQAGDVAIADLTRDGRPEIVVSQITVLQAYRYNGDLLWTVPIDDPTGIVSVSIADINGNGWLEILHMDEENFRVLDGATGVEYFRIRNTSITVGEYPVVADVTGDGQANFVVPGNSRTDLPAGTPGIRVFEADNGRWAYARGLWNQHHYSINHIDDDGTVPLEEAPSWLTHNTFRAAYQGQNPAALPDISLGRVRLYDDGQTISLEARIGSAGLVSPHDHPRLELFDGDPDAGGSLIVMQQIQGLRPGEFINVRIDELPLTLQSDELHVWINRDQAQNECRASNNFAILPWQAIVPSGQLELSLDPEEIVRGDTLGIHSQVFNAGRLPAEYTVQWDLVNASGLLVAAIDRAQLETLEPQAANMASLEWVPVNLIEGEHWIRARLLGPQGDLLDTDLASFALVADGEGTPLAGLRVSPDRPVYRRDDRVQLEILAFNRNANLNLPQARIELRILDPEQAIIGTATLPLGILGAGQQIYRAHSLNLNHADIGQYRVEAQLLSGSSGNPLAEAITGFEVLDRVALGGQVSVGWLNDQPYCTDTVQNHSLSSLEQLPVRFRLVHFDSESEILQRAYQLNLAPGESRHTQQHFDLPLDEGEYLCVLEVWQADAWEVLGTAAFELSGTDPVQPELLLWLEGPAEVSEEGTQTSLAVALSHPPAQLVNVTVFHDRPDEISLDRDQLVFDADNWNQPELVTITGLPDGIRDGDQIVWLSAQSQSTDPDFDGLLSESVSVTNVDIDLPGIEVTPATLPELNDDQPEAMIEVRLVNQPFDPVSLTLALSSEQYFSIEPQNLLFTEDDWQSAQTVLIRLRDVERAEQVFALLQLGPASSADDGYDGLEVPPVELQGAAGGSDGPGPALSPVPVPLSPWSAWLLILFLLVTVIWQRRSSHV